MSNLLDTILNLVVFAYVGVLVWVYLADHPRSGGRDGGDGGDGERHRDHDRGGADGPAASP